MSILFYIASFFAFFVGIAHSFLGERRIIGPLLKRGELPVISESEKYTARIIRVAWHMTTVLFWVIGVVLFLMERDSIDIQSIALLLACTFLPLGTLSVVSSRGRHISCLPFLIIGAVSLYAAIT